MQDTNTQPIGDSTEISQTATVSNLYMPLITNTSAPPPPQNSEIINEFLARAKGEESDYKKSVAVIEKRGGQGLPPEGYQNFYASNREAIYSQNGAYKGAFQISEILAVDAGFYTSDGAHDNVWNGSFKIPGYSDVKTPAQFTNYNASAVGAQGAALNGILDRHTQYIYAAKLNEYIGREATYVDLNNVSHPITITPEIVFGLMHNSGSSSNVKIALEKLVNGQKINNETMHHYINGMWNNLGDTVSSEVAINVKAAEENVLPDVMAFASLIPAQSFGDVSRSNHLSV